MIMLLNFKLALQDQNQARIKHPAPAKWHNNAHDRITQVTFAVSFTLFIRATGRAPFDCSSVRTVMIGKQQLRNGQKRGNDSNRRQSKRRTVALRM
ncbi:hypothetical protein F2P81_021029 [Scophthalmus maximus]|uniref:Uncharacterized protein n=1 Tax=Scophthalmus maximus TaxID=52904 RepID=A0A6A4S4N8_SCOMX|nr:hypothetical protein F2P81_021029 [Scophthalmus maximus]